MFIRLAESKVPQRRLGRHVNHDPRSRSFPHQYGGRPHSAWHKRMIPVLDQGNVGSCTGNAAMGCLGTEPFYSTIPFPKRPSINGQYAELGALDLYSSATGLDKYNGTYPPDDTGSDGLSVAKACQQAGLIKAYHWAFGMDDVLVALSNVPVLVGITWFDTFDQPDSLGKINITRTSRARGGHEVVLDAIDTEFELVWFTNSWGSTWGMGGRACMSFSTLDRLLSDNGDCTVFVPLDVPPLPPVPEVKPTKRRRWDFLRWLLET